MKKIIAGSLVGCSLLTSGVFASEPELIRAVPTLYNDISIETTSVAPVNELIKIHELVLRNNILESNYDYNNVNYFTSKIKSEDIIIPKEIKDAAKRIYFLVEEGQNRIYFAEDSAIKAGGGIDEVSKEYNYKIVSFEEGKKEYIFNNKDLVKDFDDDKYKNVQITLMAEFSDTEKIALSNTVYLSLNNKASVLQQLINLENDETRYYSYFNLNNIEKYLEKISEKTTRLKYKNMLTKAEKKVEVSIIKNAQNIKDILSSIKDEEDFSKNVDTYSIHTETQNLLVNLSMAINNQLKNIRAFDAIDSILN